ncbi:trans-sialidase, partial [Trypanosoma cruzi]
MSRRVFASAVLLLLVVMMCCCSAAASSSESSKRKLFVWRDMTSEGTVGFLFSPSLVEMNGGVFAVAGAQYTKGEESGFTGIASELLTWADEQTSKELDTTKLETQLLVECPSGNENCVSQAVDETDSESETRIHVSRPTTVVHGSNIYMIAGMYNLDDASSGEDITDEWGLLLARGNISGNNDNGRNKRIYWTDVDALTITSNTKEYEYVTALTGSVGSGVKMEDGTLLFPMEGTEKANEEDTVGGGYTVSLFIYFPDNKSWTLSKGISAGGCSDPSVVEWKDGKLMMMTACGDGRRRVYESADRGDSWTEALGTLSRVWGNKKGVRSGFITAKIDNRDVMLVTLPVYAKTEREDNGKGELHLWLTDNTHIVDIGPVSGKDEDVAASSLLYKSGDNNELIALYEKKNGDGDTASQVIVSVRLTAQLKRVKDVLSTWKEVDDRVSQLCTNLLAQNDPSPESACGADKITDGLVGFLSRSFSDNTWRDEYLGVNATVKGNDGGDKAAAAHNGVTFKGRGAWAEWPVGAQGENQLY